MLIQQLDFGKSEQELLGANILETHCGLGIQSGPFYRQDFSPAKATMLNMLANCYTQT